MGIISFLTAVDYFGVKGKYSLTISVLIPSFYSVVVYGLKGGLPGLREKCNLFWGPKLPSNYYYVQYIAIKISMDMSSHK